MDVVVTVPQRLWSKWIKEGDLAGERWSGTYSHFWFGTRFPVVYFPVIRRGDRVYIVAYRKLRGYAPLIDIEIPCHLRRRWCLLRGGGAVAVTIDEAIPGFRGWRYRWWARDDEVPFPGWQQP